MPTVWLQAANNAITTLATDLDAGLLTVNLTSVTKMPTSFPFRLTLWNGALYGYRNPADDPDMEIVEVTAWNAPYYYAGAEYLITRGMEGTADRAHSSGDTVALLITAGMIQQIQAAIAALE